MSAEATGWVFARSPMKGVAFAVHLAIADSANDQHDNRFWMSVPNLATKARCGRDAARKALRTLESWHGDDADRQLLKLLAERPGGTTEYQLLLPDLPRVTGAGSPRPGRDLPRVTGAGDPASQTRLTQVVTQGGTQGDTPAAEQPPLGDEVQSIEQKRKANARTICERVWLAKKPRPATPFVGAVKIAESLLAAGHRAAAVEAAMVAAPTVSTRAIELQLNRAAPAPTARVSTDRTAPSGRVTL